MTSSSDTLPSRQTSIFQKGQKSISLLVNYPNIQVPLIFPVRLRREAMFQYQRLTSYPGQIVTEFNDGFTDHSIISDFF